MIDGSEAENARQPATGGCVSGESPDRSPLTPLGEAIRRLRARMLQQAQPLVLVHMSDIKTVLDALNTIEDKWPLKEEGGEA